ncbi:hypothetical protein BDY24DRAFT_443810 [Mrakia frigida]|uniref:ferric reductase family protein n=1 Tax=Mrakia frigida TaxID=29902 RepID=UPI003FCBF6F9
MIAAAHHEVISAGSKNAVLALLLSFSSFFLLFAILSLPWTTVLLSRGGWKKGWWLSGQSSTSNFSSVRGKRRSSDTPMRSLRVEERIGEGEEHERAWSPPPLVNSRPLRRIPIPPGIPVHSKNVRWLNLSVLQIITFLPFVIVVALASSIGSSFLGDATRTGYVSLAMLPFILQQGYAAINWLHRWMGRLLWFIVTIHVAAYMVAFGRDGTLAEEMKRRVNINAWISYFGLNLMMLLSLRPVRRRYYQTFKIAHHVGLCFFIGGLNFHSPFVFPFLVIVIAYIASNYIYRWTTSRIHSAHLSTLPGSRTTLIRIPSVRRGWFPGQHVRIRIFSKRMGFVGWESHPFTIASSENGEGVRLLCKINGSWTQKLHDLAKEGLDENGSEKDCANIIPISLEGSYGQCNFVSSLFSSVLVVAGGSGVSFALSVAESVVRDVQSGKGRTKELVVVWSVREPGDVTLITPLFQFILDLSASSVTTSSNLNITVLIFCTTPLAAVDGGASPNLFQAIKISSSTSSPLTKDRIPTISFGRRPPLTEILKSVTDRTTKGGVVVACCGPDLLVSQMGDEVMAVDKKTLQRVGGVEYNPQTFIL